MMLPKRSEDTERGGKDKETCYVPRHDQTFYGSRASESVNRHFGGYFEALKL